MLYIIKHKSLITLLIYPIYMFDFIKKLFKTREKIGLTLDSLEEWFDQRTKSSYDDIKNGLVEVKENIENEVSKAKTNLLSLEHAGLHNDKVTVKEMQFMEGNRSFYVTRVKRFLDSLKLPESDIETFVDKTILDINNLGKSTLKAYHILQHFFSNEAYALAQNIKIIDDNLKQLKSLLTDQKIDAIDDIKANIKLLNDSIGQGEKFDIEIQEKEKSIDSLVKDKKSILAEISNKEQSHEFKEYHRLEVEKYKVNEQLTELKDEILHYFSVLEHSLRKHMKLHPEDEQFLNKYIEDPLKALVDDYELNIKKILEKLEENIHTKKIELKDKKKEKTLSVLNQINEAKLASFLTEYNSLMVELRNIEERVKEHTIIDEIEDIKIKLKKKKQEIEDATSSLENLKVRAVAMDVGIVRRQLKEKIDELLDIDLNLD